MSIYEEADRLREKMEKEQKRKLKIALFGQPGSGKSSIMNRLVGAKIAEVGVSADTTVEAQVVDWNELVLVDLPGYGTTKFPENKFFEKFEIEDFDIFLCVFSGKFHEADSNFFSQLQQENKVCLFVRNFQDTIWENGKNAVELEKAIKEDVCKHIKADKHVYFTSCRSGDGIRELSEGIFENLDEAIKAKWVMSAKAYSKKFLEKKKEECERLVLIGSGAAAANGINPLPGFDIGIDIGILFTLFAQIRKCYGLTDEKLKSEEYLKAALPLVNQVLKFASREGILLLLKRFAGKQVVKNVSKYIPLVGQAIAATMGYAITRMAGTEYVDTCHKLAEAILESELSQ